uniref:Uncharacterized protein n=1 Tax=Rhodopseudomonas palustris (strain BisA53) TaxID=316055 RepID=Q07MF8_RHOP5
MVAAAMRDRWYGRRKPRRPAPDGRQMRSEVRLPGQYGGARFTRAATVVALLLAGLPLGGCSIPLSDLPSFGGADPAIQKDADGYLAVNATPTAREEKVLEPSERAKVESELVAARARQAAAAAAAATAGEAAPPAAR